MILIEIIITVRHRVPLSFECGAHFVKIHAMTVWVGLIDAHERANVQISLLNFNSVLSTHIGS